MPRGGRPAGAELARRDPQTQSTPPARPGPIQLAKGVRAIAGVDY